jgi:hypothetical protein
VHWLTYACWPLALVHGLGTGSDTHRIWALGLEAASLLVVAGATWWRIGRSVFVPAGRRSLAALGVGAAVATLAARTFIGPLQPAWARRSGTPTRLLASTRAQVVPASSSDAAGPASSTTSAPPAALRIPFSVPITGTLHETTADANGDAIVVVDASLRGATHGRVHVVIEGPASPDGGVTMMRSRAYLGSFAQPAQFAGSVVGLDGTRIVAQLADASGRRVELALDVAIDASGRHVTGRAQARTAEDDDE